MDPKFLVIEIDSKEQALQLVQIMLNKGFARLMLLDDLSKHPTIVKPSPPSSREAACSPVFFEEPEYPLEEKVFPSLSLESNSLDTSTVIKQEPPNTHVQEEGIEEEDEEEDMVLTSRHSNKRPYNHDQRYQEQLMNMLTGEPEIVPIGVNAKSDDSPGTSEESPNVKKSKGEYHECQLCSVRVKTPRSGRWNLQMHVIALHCVGRQYKCKACNYLDYRKSTMRKHTLAQHGMDIPPHNITDNVMKTEWHKAMIKCFPEFAHRTGFLT